MKFCLLVSSLFISVLTFAQADTTRTPEPDLQTSFEKYQLLIIAIIALLLLMVLRYWFKRKQKH